MVSNYVCYDNKFYEEDQPIFRLNRAMKFGDGVFETIRVISGKVRYLDFHLERMLQGLSALQIVCTKGDIEILKVCIEQLLIKNEIEHGAILRIIAQRAGLGKYAPETDKVFFYLETERLSENGYSLSNKGLKLGISENATIYPTPFSSYKTLNALPYVLAAKEKVASKFDELILLNSEGSIAEASASNIFLIKGNSAYTPPLSDGCISGIMRRVVVNHLSNKGLDVQEVSLHVSDLSSADEVFCTNSVNGISWVSSFGSKRYFKKIASELVENI